MAFITRINTRTGATPFSVLTKTSPKMENIGTAEGKNTAVIMPMTSPAAICSIRGIRLIREIIIEFINVS